MSLLLIGAHTCVLQRIETLIELILHKAYYMVSVYHLISVNTDIVMCTVMSIRLHVYICKVEWRFHAQPFLKSSHNVVTQKVAVDFIDDP